LVAYTCAAFIFLVWLAGPATAANVPAAAVNKTITISFVASGISREPGGQTHQFASAVSEIIYVSSAGLIFRRSVAANGV
jgi:hypothetical protein